MPNSLSFTEPGLDRAWRLSSIGRLQSAIALLDDLRRGGELEGGTPAAELVWLRAFLAMATGRHDEAMRDAGDAIELFDTLGDPERRGMAVALLVWAATIVGDAPAIDEAFASLDCVDPDGVAACWLQNTIADRQLECRRARSREDVGPSRLHVRPSVSAMISCSAAG